MSSVFEASDLLEALAYRFPTAEAALAEIAHLRAVLELPRGAVHVVSDVHGEHRKLEHVLRNASGSLRPLVDRIVAARGGARPSASQLLNLIYYPRETWAFLSASLDADARAALLREVLLAEVEVLRALGCRYSVRHVERAIPEAFRGVFEELLGVSSYRRSARFVDALVAPFLQDDGGVELLRAGAHALRSLSTFELIVAGDLGDRGPRIDRVIEALRRQFNVSIVWGNHDAEWMGACLGQEALIATVLRISLRYGRIAQLEEGYGIPVEPLEALARAAYADDPAERFLLKDHAKGQDLRDPLLLARMQKAAAILQFKLEGQTLRRNPSFDMEHRNLLHRIDPVAKTVAIDGHVHPLLDASFPTVDFADPYALTEPESVCLAHLKRSFLGSSALWRDMTFVAEHGSMYAIRDEHLVFHGCVPVDASGAPLEVEVDGARTSGRALFDACESVVRRAFRDAQAGGRRAEDLDRLYWLWAAPRSPLFGKDRMATFETYFVEDKAAREEKKNPYFKLIHEVPFCEGVARMFGVDPGRVLIVNGHVPVKLEQGESPLKESKLCVTIDGAFSEAYGDHGYTLVIDADCTYLAKHHHFESVESAIAHGADIVPEIEPLRVCEPPRRVADTASGARLRREIDALEALVRAHRGHALRPNG
ncbi:MAG: fructose-bisphosphatase class III [Polyangiaceae bacterium]